MTISDKSKLEMRNQNYKQKEKMSHNGKKTVNNTVANESADGKINYPVFIVYNSQNRKNKY